MKTYRHYFGRPALGLALLLLASACSTLRDRDLLARSEPRPDSARQATIAPPAAGNSKMYVRTPDGGVALTDDFSTRAQRAAALRRVEQERAARRHEARALKSQYLLPE